MQLKTNYNSSRFSLILKLFRRPGTDPIPRLPIYRRLSRSNRRRIRFALMQRLNLLFIAGLLSLAACNKKVATPKTLDPSPAGNLGRYDLATEDYDILPVTTFVFSYDNSNNITNAFEKSGQTLIAYALNYDNGHLTQTTDNSLGVQNFSYDGNGRLTSLNFMDLADTGSRTFTYDSSGLLLSFTDSVKKPNALPTLMQYALTYDSTRSNVVVITQNRLDLEHRPTLVQENFYSFDDKPNPFNACPWLRDATTLPGSLPALINKNNVVGTHIVGTIFQTSGGSSVPKLDTITNYISTRQYTYNSKGYPVSCAESFQDLQYNYSGNRSFTYDY